MPRFFSRVIFYSEILGKDGAFRDRIPPALGGLVRHDNLQQSWELETKGPGPGGLAEEMTNGSQYENSFQVYPESIAQRAVLLGSLNSIYFCCELRAKAIMKACLQFPKF